MPRRIDKNAKRKEILEAAARVFARDGFANTKISDVAALAGIGKGTVYEYFPSKDELFLQVCTELIEWPAPPATGDAVRDLERLITALVESYERSKDFFRILVEFWSVAIRDTSAHGAAFLAGGEGFYEQPRRLLTEAIRQGQKSGALTTRWGAENLGEIILAVIEGLRIRRMVDPRVSLTEDLALLFGVLRAALIAQPRTTRKPVARTRRQKRTG